MPDTIRKLEAFPIRIAYVTPIADSRSVIVWKSTVLLRIEDDDGCYGWGEAASFGDVAHLVAEVLNTKIFPVVRGLPAAPRRVCELIKRVTAHYGQRGLVVNAMSGLDIAIWDLLGRKAGLPLSTLLGGQPREVEIYAGTGYYSAERLGAARDLEGLRFALHSVDRAKYAGIKIKVGRYGIEDSVKRIELARDHLGANGLLIADANNAFSPRDALTLAQSITSFGVSFLEEPIEFGQPEVSKELALRSPVPIGGYELEMTYDGYYPYISMRAVDIIQPDCIWSGGVTECLHIAHAAERFGLEVVPHNFCSPISTAANYHLVCATAHGKFLEIDATDSPLSDLALVEDAREYKDGKLVIASRPGIGIEPNYDAVRELSSRCILQ